ncbi:hypothetical protein CVS47_02140 [Microbacterium lemovicicum]|uniref:Glycine transporter domain-containing protein n=1 Tax=Microbacterium lemovicicum TaxID=1072463 RepID=A0A3S9WBT4_9MICO|nr:hypothetical protein CVS47_02140 [Microbacterium lemovicicum]
MSGVSSADTPAAAASLPSLRARTFTIIDVAATALFGIEGAAAAVHAGLDVLGVLVVGFVVALAGGMLRDVLLGDLPPAALRTPSRIITAIAAAAAAFLVVGVVDAIPGGVLITLDALGLALFAMTGAEKASSRGANLWVVTILGGITATGGGVLRDVLLLRTPVVLTESVYGTAALAGALATGIVMSFTRRPRTAMLVGFVVAFSLRMLAVTFGWQLPRAL